MAAWLVEHFIWVALLIVVLVVGLKVAIGGFLKRLMDESAAREAARDQDTGTPRNDNGTR